MKKLILILLLLPSIIKATCTTDEIKKNRNLASNISTYYEYNEEQNTFDVTIYNISSRLKIKNNNDTYYSDIEGIGQAKINNINPGTMITLGVYAKEGDCSDYRVQTIYVNLPYYNKYYKEEICKNNTNKLCSKWANTSNYTYEQLSQAVKQEEEIITPPQPEIEKKSYTFLSFLEDFYIPILLLIIVSGSIGIYVLNKKSKFDF